MSGSQTQPAGAPQAAAADPSMEDILASIRRILSEEDVPGAEPVEAANDEAPAAGQAQDVLILDKSMLVTDVPLQQAAAKVPPAVVIPMPVAPAVAVAVPDMPPPEADPPPPPVKLAVSPVLVAVPPSEEPDTPIPIKSAAAEPHSAVVSPQPESPTMSASMMSSNNIASAETTAAAAGSVSNLVRALTSDRGAQVSSGGPTIADLVREEMRPILKAWLDTNLPPMVERMVRAEIDRVIARATL